ncbi:MAG: hypothetical protein AB7E51_16835 [Pseudodesulfovibrio sp.]|uniref:DUF3887 domain-containing protein n=1 Tax=Pseudodesulfovibrio indicus TaxID=1716143 RepID=A0A140D8T3_9BACT|nr:hypothetical protein [Pseudodesulfovibrio indicus]AMK09600.1 hypothetical protein AWY79_00005 [Pseudodesulfovibrio indicus]TDT86453.1 hypothetical protein EDC59_113129 [Pseudodesulfovibrio indicus]
MRTLYTALFLILALALAAPAAQAADIEPPSGWKQEGPEAHAERFLDLMVQGQLDNAFNALLGNAKTDAMDKLKFEIYSEYKKNGKPLGYEQVLKQHAGKTVLRLRYILLFPNLPKTFDIYYYNPDGRGWKLRTFSYVKDIKQLFKD